MNRFWSWFIPLFIIICLTILSLIIKVKEQNKIILSNILEEPILITNINERDIYSKFAINKYHNKDLQEVLDNNELDINNLANLMEYSNTLNDGGTIILHSNEIANQDFYMIICNTIDGNNDTYITNQEDYEYCER